jgi:hypothetical protein
MKAGGMRFLQAGPASPLSKRGNKMILAILFLVTALNIIVWAIILTIFWDDRKGRK